MKLRTGGRYRSAVDDTEVIITRVDGAEGELTCGGVPMRGIGAMGEQLPIESGQDAGTALGKRYGSDTLEVLVTKPGGGTLALDGAPLEMRAAKPLPASD